MQSVASDVGSLDISNLHAKYTNNKAKQNRRTFKKILPWVGHLSILVKIILTPLNVDKERFSKGPTPSFTNASSRKISYKNRQTNQTKPRTNPVKLNIFFYLTRNYSSHGLGSFHLDPYTQFWEGIIN